MMELAASMALYGGTSLPEALAMRESVIRSFFSTKAFADYQKSKESEGKVKAAMIDRLNSIISVICQLPKAMAPRA